MNRIPWIDKGAPPDTFPPLDSALRDPDGLLAAGGDLSAARLVAAYRRGIFPWYSQGQPILWWSPDPRAVLFPAEFKTSRSLNKSARQRGFEARFDEDFTAVIAACADPALRPDGTWITRDMQAAYLALHQHGFAHCMATWQDGALVGGLYGVQLGRVFYGESMFSRVSDASKFALKMLCQRLLEQGVVVIDCQMATPHLLSLGARLISRREFAALLQQHAHLPPPPVG